MQTAKIWVLVGLAAFCQACTEVRQSPEGKRRLVMGVSADYPPFEYKKNGEIVGLDVDVAREIAKDLGYSLVVQDMDFASLIPALQSGVIDFAMSGMTATEERRKNMDFSGTYYVPSFSVIFPKSSPILSEKALSHMKVGVQLGTTMEKYLKAKAKSDPTLEILSLARNPVLIEELKAGRIQGVVTEEVQAAAFVQANQQLAYAALSRSGDGYAIAFPKNKSIALRDSFNSSLNKLRESGVLDQMRQSRFGNSK